MAADSQRGSEQHLELEPFVYLSGATSELGAMTVLGEAVFLDSVLLEQVTELVHEVFLYN